MNVEFSRLFEKQIDRVTDKKLRSEISTVVRNVMEADSIQNILNLKKLSGFKDAYRIRTGNYRIGIIIKNNKVLFSAFAHRKDIYNIFP